VHENYSKKTISKQAFLGSPKLPGVYIYWTKAKVPIYVGKAINLKNRLNSYLNLKLEPKTARLMQKAYYFSVIKVTNEVEALLLEAKLVGKFKPKFNIQLKDDKHPLYIKIIDGRYPIVKTARKVEIGEKTRNVFGPFPSGANVKFVLRFIRKIISYSDHMPQKKPCLYSQIGLCNPCPSVIAKEDDMVIQKNQLAIYKENIRLVRNILSGKTNQIYKQIEKNMKIASKLQNFEKANYYKQILERLNYISQPIGNVDKFMENPNLLEDVRFQEIVELEKVVGQYLKVGKLHRIECFDIAHLLGQNPTASMVTIIDGFEEKNLYRRFRIFQKKTQSDTDSMAEVARRRKKHLADWGVPDLIVVDGGRTQLNVFLKEFDGEDMPIIGLAKRFETIIIKVNDEFVEIRATGGALNVLQRIRNEAHRFARVYHHSLVTKTLLGKN